MINEDENLKGLSLEELQSRKEMAENFLTKVYNAIDDVNKIKRKNEVADKLRKLLSDNSQLPYFCITRKRHNTGPTKHYFVNNPKVVFVDERIGIGENLFDTFYDWNGSHRTVCTSNQRDDKEFFREEDIEDLIENGEITFLTKEGVEQQLSEDSFIYLKELVEKHNKEICNLRFTIKPMKLSME